MTTHSLTEKKKLGRTAKTFLCFFSQLHSTVNNIDGLKFC